MRFVDEADYLDPENNKEIYHYNGDLADHQEGNPGPEYEKTSFTTTTTKGSGPNGSEDDSDNIDPELGSEDSEDVVVLEDPIENFIKDRLLAEDFSHETLATILESVFGPEGELFPRKGASSRPTAFGENDDPSRRVSLGYYGHGSFRGICHRTPDYASLSLYLKYYIRSRHPEARWTSMCISLNHKANIHTDRNNLKGTYNYVTCGGSYAGGGVWCENDKSQDGGGGEKKNIKDEKDRSLSGTIHPTKGEVAMFRGDRRHATEDWCGGHRWMVACFTSRAIVESTKEEKKRLRQWGYPVPDLRHLAPDRKTLKGVHDDIKDNSTPKLFPKYSTRKSMWKTAIRASAFFTWSLASMAAVRDQLYPERGGGPALFEIGGNKQTLEIAGVDGMDFVEPLDWKDLEGSDSKGRVRDALGTLRPGVLWLHPPNLADDYKFARTGTYVERSQRVFYEILGECGQFHVEQSGTLVVEVPTGREELKNYVYNKLHEFGEVTEHHFNDLHFYKVKRRAYHEALVSTSTTRKGDGDHQEPGEERPLREGASGITFGKDVKNDVAIALRRLHQNLGHPSNADLTRHLRLAGASEEVLKGSRSLTCETCRRCSGPKSPKPASEPKLLEFNDVVAVDMFFAFDVDKKKQKLLSMIDCASSYHVVIKVPNQTGDTLEKTFLKHWIQIFGAPKVISLDLETGIQDAFSRLSDWFRIDLQTSAGQAHWQAGFAERHGKWWKEIFKKVVEEKSVTNDEAEIAVAATSLAKNTLRRKCGWAPCQIVFGKTPRDDEDVAEQEIDDGVWVARTPDDAQHRRDAIRAAAKIAFMKVRAEDKVRRGSLQRARVRGRDLANGEMALFWRKDKNNKKGAWRGPGVVIGRQQDNYWIARGGRCQLCAPEHIRPASPEELGGLFALRATQADLQRLIENDHDDEETYQPDEDIADEDDDIFGDLGDMSVDEAADPDELLEFPNEDIDYEDQGGQRRRREVDGERDQPAVKRRVRMKTPQEALMLKRAVTKRGREKQLEKEIPWHAIPVDKRPLFQEAEAKQWEEHLKLGALTPLDVETSFKIVATEGNRILTSRFAYRDKNLARRRADPGAPWKAKSRLVIGGHADPDVVSGALRTDSPTVSRTAIMCLLQIAASRLDEDWSVSAGDVTAAFLNGDPLERRLFLRQPRHGLPGLHPSQIIRVDKGVFGLVDSPRMWWRRFRKDIQQQWFRLGDGSFAKFSASPLDPCVFQLIQVRSDGEKFEGARPLCYAAVHVDDILLVGPRTLSHSVQEQLSTCFPVEEWENDVFDFIGSHIEVRADEIRVSQGGYVESRLFEVNIDPSVPDDSKATSEQVADNRSLIGALSWLASQTRPDLACGVSMAQQLQANPTVEDVKFTNLLARRALQHGQEAIVLRKINLQELIVAVFHDAGWANVPDRNDDPEYFLSPSDEERGIIREGPWANKERRAKRKNSSVASQLGMLVLFTEARAVQGGSALTSIVEWKSHACDRVCRSTFGAETMGCIEGIELAYYVRAMIASLLSGELTRRTGEEYPLVAMTDCRSLYDHFHKDGLPRTPSDRRLAIDIACLRQTLQAEARAHADDDTRAPLVWVPTELQRADLLTKPKKSGDWWNSSSSLTIPVREKMFLNQCKSVGAGCAAVASAVNCRTP